jgi:phosphohistidine phosphatase
MLLLLMRHGIAAPLSDAIGDDFYRPLTQLGKKRTRAAALGLLRIAPSIDAIFSSPKTRAVQTARIVHKAAANPPRITEWPELMDDHFAAIQEKLQKISAETVLLCGHEPHLSRLASQFLTGNPETLAFDWKKAGVCALQLENDATSAIFLWHLTPKQLREIA